MQPTKGSGLIENSSDQQNVFWEETVNSESLLSLNSQVIDAMFEHKVKAGETVIRQGDDGDYFYVVEEGVYHALINCDDGSMKKVIAVTLYLLLLTELPENISRCLSITGRATSGSWLSCTICQERPLFRLIIGRIIFQPPAIVPFLTAVMLCFLLFQFLRQTQYQLKPLHFVVSLVLGFDCPFALEIFVHQTVVDD